jgi:hypothetical protein
MGDPLADLLPTNQTDTKNPENPIDWEMWLVKNDSKWDFSIHVNDSKNPVPINFKAGQVRAFPLHRAKWLASQLAQKIKENEWKEEEKETGRPSNKLWIIADPTTMAKEAAKLLLGKEDDLIDTHIKEEDIIEPSPIATPKKGNAEALRKWREAQKAK